MDIIRNLHSEIKELAEDFPAIGIIGSRQTGKTTLVKNLQLDWDRPMVYVDLENPNDIAMLADPMIFFDQYPDHTIILDEVQVKPDIFPVLRSVIDQNRVAGRFILLGSVSPNLLRGTSESLAGRIAYVELTPLSLDELDDDYSYKAHWFRGGYPLSVLVSNDKKSSRWRANYIRTYVERDLPQLGLSASPPVIRTLWSMLAHVNGSLLNSSSLSRSLGLTHPTISGYLDFLEGAFLIRRLTPFHFNIKKRLVKSPKLYFRDTGLLHQLLGVAAERDLILSPHVGASWENYVVEQICRRVIDRYNCHFYRTHQGTECDLVLVQGLTPKISIEVKFSSGPKLTKGFAQAIEDLGTKDNYIIAPVNVNFSIREDIQVMDIRSFLRLI